MLKNADDINIGLKLQLLLLGMISMSKICSIIFQDMLHISIIIPEIFWVLFFIVNYKRYQQCLRMLQNKWLLISLIYVVAIALVSVLSGRGLVEAGSELRGIVAILFFAVLLIRYTDVNLEGLWWLCFGVLLGDTFYIFNTGVTHLTVNHTAWASACILCFLVKGRWKIPLTYGVCMMGAVASTYRINVLLAVMNLAIGILWLIFKKRKQNVRTVVVKAGALIAGITLIIYIYNHLITIVSKLADLFNMSSIEKYRTVNRLQQLLDGTAAQETDVTRINLMKLIYEDFVANLLPAGVLNKQVYASGIYQDTPMLVLYNYFGSLISVLIVLIFTVISMFIFIRVFRKYGLDSSYVYAGLMVPTMFALLLLNGFFLIGNYAAIITGIVIGLIIRYWRQEVKIRLR